MRCARPNGQGRWGREHRTAQHSTRPAALQVVSIDGQRSCGTISTGAIVNTIDCGNKLGRNVMVALQGSSNALTLREVEIWGSPPGPPSVPLGPPADTRLTRVTFMVSCSVVRFRCSIRWRPLCRAPLLRPMHTRLRGPVLPHLHRVCATLRPHLHRDWARHCNLHAGIGLTASHICNLPCGSAFGSRAGQVG